jgi:hypothetical protein
MREAGPPHLGAVADPAHACQVQRLQARVVLRCIKRCPSLQQLLDKVCRPIIMQTHEAVMLSVYAAVIMPVLEVAPAHCSHMRYGQRPRSA